jgi:hypothetical protein
MTGAEIAHLAVAAAHAAVAAAVVSRWGRLRSTVAGAAVLVVAAALVYENLVLAMGSTLGIGDTLETLSLGRFVLHALVTPLILAAAIGIDRASRDRVPHVPVLGWLAVGLLIAAGVAGDLGGIHLESIQEAGVLRYIHPDSGFPWPSVLVVVVAIVVGVRQWRAGNGALLLVGSVIMFVASGASPAFEGVLVGNVAEAIFLASLLAALPLAQTATPQPVGAADVAQS